MSSWRTGRAAARAAGAPGRGVAPGRRVPHSVVVGGSQVGRSSWAQSLAQRGGGGSRGAESCSVVGPGHPSQKTFKNRKQNTQDAQGTNGNCHQKTIRASQTHPHRCRVMGQGSRVQVMPGERSPPVTCQENACAPQTSCQCHRGLPTFTAEMPNVNRNHENSILLI